MDKEKFENYIENRFKNQRKWYSDKSSINKKRYQSLQIIIIIISSIIPVVTFIQWEYGKIFATGLAVIISISTSLITTFKFQENWLNYRTTSELLKKEKSYFDAKINEYAKTDNPESLFVERVEDLISVESRQWKTTQETQ